MTQHCGWREKLVIKAMKLDAENLGLSLVSCNLKTAEKINRHITGHNGVKLNIFSNDCPGW